MADEEGPQAPALKGAHDPPALQDLHLHRIQMSL